LENNPLQPTRAVFIRDELLLLKREDRRPQGVNQPSASYAVMRADTLVLLPKRAIELGTLKHDSVVKVLQRVEHILERSFKRREGRFPPYHLQVMGIHRQTAYDACDRRNECCGDCHH
jgi:hypothetical protein